MGGFRAADAHVGYSLLEYGVAVLAIYLLMVLIRRSPKNLPPGPTGLPIIGSLHLLGERPHEALAQMAQKYNARLLSLYMGQKLCIVASSAETAMEVLKTQDATFSSRPPLRGFEVIFPKDITFSDITPASRQLRKIFHSQLTSARRIEESEHIRTDEILQMLRSIPSDKVVNIKSCLEVMTANILTRLIISKRFMGRSGGELDTSEKKELKDFIHITEEIGLCLGTPNPRDVIPAFKYIDLNGLDRRFKNLRSHMESFLSKIVAERHHRRTESLGSMDPSSEKDLLDILLDQMDTKANEQDQITGEVVTSIVWEAFAAGMETSVLATEWTMAEILNNPKVLSKAQAELDAVVGRTRTVQESDIPNLKYLKAVVKEAFRLHPVIPLLVPHQSNAACRAFGYDIPAETRLLVNVWAIGRDPAVWSNPLHFDPERFLGDGPHGGTDFSGKGFNLLTFGAGRRMCMGVSLGELLVESSVASLLHCFSWSLPGELDMSEGVGLSVRKAVPLSAIASPRLPPHVYAH
ncbi:hypothetical protein M758_6G078700 [Ceratodon purpureus]|nr:hypothetical protein M758_6G078700 [Ceratodon purpureus]